MSSLKTSSKQLFFGREIWRLCSIWDALVAPRHRCIWAYKRTDKSDTRTSITGHSVSHSVTKTAGIYYMYTPNVINTERLLQCVLNCTASRRLQAAVIHWQTCCCLHLTMQCTLKALQLVQLNCQHDGYRLSYSHHQKKRTANVNV